MWVMRQRSFLDSLFVIFIVGATQVSLHAQDLSELADEFELQQSALASYIVNIDETRLSKTELSGGIKFSYASKFKHQIIADISQGKYLVFKNNKQSHTSSIDLFEIPGRQWKSINGNRLRKIETTPSANPYSEFPEGVIPPKSWGLVSVRN